MLREKQNHIEHLLIERDLDRQDADNNAMMYQKTINQVCIRRRPLQCDFLPYNLCIKIKKSKKKTQIFNE